MYWKGRLEHPELSGVISLMFLIRKWNGNERREDPGALGSDFLIVFINEKQIHHIEATGAPLFPKCPLRFP